MGYPPFISPFQVLTSTNHRLESSEHLELCVPLSAGQLQPQSFQLVRMKKRFPLFLAYVPSNSFLAFFRDWEPALLLRYILVAIPLLLSTYGQIPERSSKHGLVHC